MGKVISEIREEVRQVLQDVFQTGTDLTWGDEELEQAIESVLLEISQASPYQTRITAESDGTKKIDLTDIDDFDPAGLIRVEKAEYEVDQDPEQFRNVSRFGDILTLAIDTAPTSGDDIYLYCEMAHTLDEEETTLNREQESLLVKGAAAQAAISKSRKYIDSVNVGGTGVPSQLYNWGAGQMGDYKRGLWAIRAEKKHTEYEGS
jgi:hypothetical protein